MYVLHPSAILWKMVVLEVFLRGLLILNPHLCHNSLLNALLGVQIIGADTHVHTARGYIRRPRVLSKWTEANYIMWPNGVEDDVRVERGGQRGRTKRLTGLFSLKAPLSLSLPLTSEVVVVVDLLAAVGFPSISRRQRLKLRIRRHS